ncbi:3 protein [Cytorhabdovirus hordei]|uniref:3 protein n=1 Tax=Cytorhabdovirus hordei TaxID=1985699 RepID=A0A0C5KR40_9RHAB|nr:3 protein [Cytorhabdovirus hordei]AJP67517.1 3 protein [Cytorhabdovirus hordei]
MDNKRERMNFGVKGTIAVRHDIVTADVEMKTSPGLFACFAKSARYTSLMSVTIRYQPHITSSSHGEIVVSCLDRRNTDETPIAVHKFPTDKKTTFAISGFDCSLTEDCCPIVVNVSQELTGLVYGAAVGELIIMPSFKCSNIPHSVFKTEVKEITGSHVTKKYGGMLIALD